MLRVLQGRKIQSTDKVIPATTSLDSVFLCLNGHGDSARCLPRCSLRLSQIECDLCNKPHQERTERIDQTFDFKTLTANQWMKWLQEDFVPLKTSMTNSKENDRILDVDDPVITLCGSGKIVAVRRIQKVPSKNRNQYCLPTLEDPYVRSKTITFDHSYIYDVQITTPFTVANYSIDSTDSTDSTNSMDGTFQVLGTLQAFSTLTHGKYQLPPCAAILLEEYLGTTERQRLITFIFEARPKNCVITSCRRDFLVMSKAPSIENHYHSSLKSREWFFGMLHSSVQDEQTHPLWYAHDDPYAFVASRYAGTHYKNYLYWQQMFQGLHTIRARSPTCKLLCLMESCYSGGSIKFLKNDCASWYNQLESWPIFLIATAGEAQTSFGGQFLPLFLQNVKQAVAKSEANAKENVCIETKSSSSSSGGTNGTTLMNVFQDSVQGYNRRNNKPKESGVINGLTCKNSKSCLRKPSVDTLVKSNQDINMSFSEKTGIGDCDIIEFFTR